MPYRLIFRARWVVLVASMLLGGCAGTPSRGRSLRYTWPDSVTNSCRQSPSLCAKVPGEQPLLPLSGPASVAASAGITGQAVLRVLEATTQARVDEMLKECADLARSEVLLRHLGNRSPTPAECNEVVSRDARGKPVTRAMQLGQLMHQEALKCSEDELNELLPGRFSLEPCYRYDSASGRVSLVSPEERQSLLRQGRSCELLGSLVPDVVIHTGNPLEAEAVYDFKFPCVNSDEAPSWREYPRGHPHAGRQQGAVYEQAFNTSVGRVVPRLGVIR
jgi:hypothetical protein